MITYDYNEDWYVLVAKMMEADVSRWPPDYHPAADQLRRQPQPPGQDQRLDSTHAGNRLDPSLT
jgi:hypothetical protein